MFRGLILAATVTVTAYVPSMTAERGALGLPLRPGKTVAVSQDLRHLLGREIHIEGIGWRWANDTMPAQWSKRLDLCVEDRATALAHGVKRLDIHIPRSE